MCGVRIELCNGFTILEDFVLFMEYKKKYIRELCGKCVLKRKL